MSQKTSHSYFLTTYFIITVEPPKADTVETTTACLAYGGIRFRYTSSRQGFRAVEHEEAAFSDFSVAIQCCNLKASTMSNNKRSVFESTGGGAQSYSVDECPHYRVNFVQFRCCWDWRMTPMKTAFELQNYFCLSGSVSVLNDMEV